MDQWEIQQAVDQERRQAAAEEAELHRRYEFQRMQEENAAWNERRQGEPYRPIVGEGPVRAPTSSAKVLRNLAVWAAVLWAFCHLPAMTQGPMSGPLAFGTIAAALLITVPSLKTFVFGCLIPFILLGLLVLFALPALIAGNGSHRTDAPKAPQHTHHTKWTSS